MRIVLVNHYAVAFDQAGGTRHIAMARRWVQAGHDVTIVASSIDYTTRSNTRLQHGQDYLEEVHDGVRFVWLRTPEYHSNGVRRLYNMLMFAAKAQAVAYRQPDVVIGSSPHPFAALAARKIARRHVVPFVLEVRDLWPDSLVDIAGVPRWHPLVVWLRRIEKKLYRSADRIVCLLPNAKHHIARGGASPDSVHIIPNGIDLAAVPSFTPAPARTPLTFVYAGAHGVANGLDIVLDAAQLLQQSPQSELVRFRLIGDGPRRGHLQSRAEKMGLTNVDFIGPVPKAQIYEHLQAADGCLMVLKPSPVFRHGISPNKLFDYMAAGRPVLFGVDTPTDPITASGGGVRFAPDSAADLAAAVMRVAELDPAQRNEMGMRARAYVESHHSLEFLASEFEKVLAQVVTP